MVQLPMQSVPIPTFIVSSNTTHGKVYSIQRYVIKFVCDLRQVSVFSTNKTDQSWYSWNIVESAVKYHNLNP